MTKSQIARSPSTIGAVLLVALIGSGGALAAWKDAAIKSSNRASANQPEPMEVVTTATAQPREYRATATAIGTVLAMESVTLQNELSGTVRQVYLVPGRIVNAGTVLVALDVSVERAELQAQQARLELAETSFDRLSRLLEQKAAAVEELDRARAERDVAQADIARTKAIIERKTIRAPFRAQVGLTDVHTGQYLAEGTTLTTLQGVSDAANVDFTVAQAVASRLHVGDFVLVSSSQDAAPVKARIVAIDSRVNPTTRNTLVRARLNGDVPVTPGASVRVEIPQGAPIEAVSVPVTALRKGPSGDHVFVIAADSTGKSRASLRTVKAGDVVGDEVVILDGVKPGEAVAASGAFKLREGVLVVDGNATQQQGSH